MNIDKLDLVPARKDSRWGGYTEQEQATLAWFARCWASYTQKRAIDRLKATKSRKLGDSA